MTQGRAAVARSRHAESALQWPQQMTGGIDDIALRALLGEELSGDEQCSGENEREHRGRELTGIIHRGISLCGSHGKRRPTIAGSFTPQINCHIFPNFDSSAGAQ